MIEGVLAFFKAVLIVFSIAEGTFLLEQWVSWRREYRRGFSGTKSSLFQAVRRQVIVFLRQEASITMAIRFATKATILFVAVSMLPIFGGKYLDLEHSIWLFWGLILIGPLLSLFFQWVYNQGKAWPNVLRGGERSLGAITAFIFLGAALAVTTGVDSFSGMQAFQQKHGWLLFAKPLSLVIMCAFLVASHYLNFQHVFRGAEYPDRPEGWVPNDFIPFFMRTVSSLFVVVVFLGGAPAGGLAIPVIILKTILVNVLSSLFLHDAFQLTEAQAENLILSRLVPASVAVFVLTLVTRF